MNEERIARLEYLARTDSKNARIWLFYVAQWKAKEGKG